MWWMLACVHRPPALDWDTSWRWVHIDHVDPAQVARFEEARVQWLAAIDGAPDGRPLLWSGQHGESPVYFTFYPFARYRDLDARSEVTGRTEARVGQATVEAYDTASDGALVPPHLSELWRRFPELDFAPAGAPALDERTATRAGLEYRRMPTAGDLEALDKLWPDLLAAMQTQPGMPACRAYRAAYGGGEIVLMWLGAKDEALADPLSFLEGTPLGEQLGALMPVVDRATLTRRPELSSLP